MKLFIVYALLFFGVLGNISSSNAKETIPGLLEVYWEVTWDCKPPCTQGVELYKNLRARFYPKIIPRDIRNLSLGQGIVIALPSMTQDELERLSSSRQDIPASFMRHKERFWRAEATLAFRKKIQSFVECDAWYYQANDVKIISIGDASFTGDDDLVQGCNAPYNEVFHVAARSSGQKVVIRSEMDVASDVVAVVEADDRVLKLETMEDGSSWLRVKHLRYADEIIGFLYLPDVLLSPLN